MFFAIWGVGNGLKAKGYLNDKQVGAGPTVWGVVEATCQPPGEQQVGVMEYMSC